MLDLPSSTTTVSASGVEILPYCRAVLSAATPGALVCAARGNVTLARSSSVIFSAGLSSAFAIIPLSCRGLLPLARRRRILHFRRSLDGRSGRKRHQLLQYLLARLDRMLHDLLARPQQRGHFIGQALIAQYESQAQHGNVSHDPAGPFHPRRFSPPTLGPDSHLRVNVRIAVFLIVTRPGAGDLHALRVSQANTGKLFSLAADPAKTPFFIGVRIIDPGNLLWTGEEVFLDKKIMLGKEHAKTGMGMVPADNLHLWKLLVFDLVNVLPGVLGKGDVGPALRGVDSRNASFDQSAVLLHAADQHSAHFGFHGSAGVLAYFARDLRLHDDHRLGFDFHLNFNFRRHGDASGARTCGTIAASGRSTAFSSPAIRYASSRSPARATKASKSGR